MGDSCSESRNHKHTNTGTDHQAYEFLLLITALVFHLTTNKGSFNPFSRQKTEGERASDCGYQRESLKDTAAQFRPAAASIPKGTGQYFRYFCLKPIRVKRQDSGLLRRTPSLLGISVYWHLSPMLPH